MASRASWLHASSARCDDYGTRFEEGSEHFFAYAFEFVNVHHHAASWGSLGVLIMSALQAIGLTTHARRDWRCPPPP
jgi:hypothetical protein